MKSQKNWMVLKPAAAPRRWPPSAAPAEVFQSWGVKSDMQGRNVTSITQAKCILRAITGNLDVIGGDMLTGPCEKANYGVMLEHMDQLSAEQRKKQLGADQHKLWCFPGYKMVAKAAKPYWYGKGLSAGFLPGCHEPAVWDAILEAKPYQVRGLICGACNPLVAYPNTKRIYKALKSKKLELFVVAEQWMTPSAMLADYVFPITNWLEHPQLYTQTFQGSGSAAALGERVVSPLFERRSDFELYRGLGLKLGQKKYWRDTLDQEWDWCLQPLLKELNLETSQDFAKTQRWWSPPALEKRYASIGKIKQKAKLTSRIPPRMVESQYGWWFPEEIGEDPVLFGVFESNVNVLTPDSEEFCDPATGAVTFGPLLCRVYPLKIF